MGDAEAYEGANFERHEVNDEPAPHLFNTVHASELKYLSWGIMGEQLWWGLVCQISIALICKLILHPCYALDTPPRALQMQPGFRGFVARHFGPPSEIPQKTTTFTTFVSIQFFCSLGTISCWTKKSYDHELLPEIEVLELIFAAFFVVHYLIYMVKQEFAGSHVWSMDAVIDVFTIVPMVIQGRQRSWLSVSYMRSWRLLKCYHRLEASGLLDDVSDLHRGMILGMINFFTLVFTLAATEFTLEVLGPIDGFEDSFITTTMGDISMWQMYYWMITTISTVGYGDFAPTNFMSRGFTAVAIGVGVVFFTIQSGEVYNLKQLEESGRGKFHPKRHGGKHGMPGMATTGGHVLVCGGAVNSSGSVVLREFFKELLDPMQGKRIPEAVLLGHNKLSEDLHLLLQEPWMKKHCKFLRGSPLSAGDMVRAKTAKALMAFVLANILAENPDLEDEQNILAASSLLKTYPQLPMRVMLLRPENRQLAVNLGLDINVCFAINEWKANLLAQSCRVEGFIPLLLNMTRKRPCDENFLSPEWKIDREGHFTKLQATTWKHEFAEGAQATVAGMLLPPSFKRMTFKQCAERMFTEKGIYLLGVQRKGRVLLNPQDQEHLQPDVVLFVAVHNDEQLKSFATSRVDGTEWIDRFVEQRRMASHRDHIAHQEKFQRQPWQDDPEFTSVESLAAGGNDRKPPQAGRSKKPTNKGLALSSGFLLHDPDATNQEDMMRTMNMDPSEREMKKESKFSSMIDVRVTLPGLPKIIIPRSKKPRMSISANFRVQETQELTYAVDETDNQTDGRLDMIVKHGSHYVVILMTDGVWQQVEAIILPLRQPYLHRWVPIVIITPVSPPAKLKNSHTGVYWVTGNPHHVPVLDKVGIRVARSIILLTGKPMRQEPVMMDHQVVLTASLIEAQVSNVATDIPLIIDMHNPHNLGQLAKDIPSSFDKRNTVAALKENIRRGSKRRHSKEWVPKAMRRRAKSITHVFNKDPNKSYRVDAEANPGMHPRFASGRVMSRVDLCTVFATAFYTPGVMEVMEAFLLPGRRDQVAFTFSIPVPFSHVGMKYIDLYLHWMESGVLSYGLYRPCKVSNNAMPFCFSFPHPSTELHPQDKVFVLAPADWAKDVLMEIETQLTATLKIQAVFRHRQNLSKKKKNPTRIASNTLINPRAGNSSPTHSDVDLEEEIGSILKTAVGTSNSLPMVTQS